MDDILHTLNKIARTGLGVSIDKERIKMENKDIMEFAYNNNVPLDKSQETLDTSPVSTNNYIIFKTSSELHNKFIASDTKLDTVILKQLLKQLLRQKRIMKDGRLVKLKDCVVVDSLTQAGSYYPRFHTDIQYEIFNKTNSFQIWYLVRNEHKTGNMFIITSDESNVKYTPSWLHLKGDTLNVRSNTISTQFDTTVNGKIKLDNVKISYLDIAPGECFVMGQNVWHASDIRTDARLAVNFRVIIRERDGSVKHNGDRMYLRPHHVYDAANKRAYNIGLFDLI
jgi:hypothetical protein